MVDAYPLQWPAHVPRSKYRQDSRFKQKSLVRVRDELYRELELLGARYVVISTNRPTRLDGEFRAGSSEPLDSAVAVYFRWNGQDRVLACDAYYRMIDNLWSIAKTIEALRGIDRWGVNDVLNAVFKGFYALPAPICGGALWYEVLGVTPNASIDEIRTARSKLAVRFHPDTARVEASHERMAAINAAAEEGLRLRRSAQ